MPIEFDVHITEKLLRRVARRRLFQHWPRLLFAVLLIVVSTVLEIRQGTWSTFSTVGVTALGFLLLIYPAIEIRQWRSIAAWKRMQGDAPVHYRLNEEVLQAQSHLGSTELKWTVFRELIEHHDCLLLAFVQGNHLTLPREGVPPEALDFIRRKFQELKLPVKRA